MTANHYPRQKWSTDQTNNCCPRQVPRQPRATNDAWWMRRRDQTKSTIDSSLFTWLKPSIVSSLVCSSVLFLVRWCVFQVTCQDDVRSRLCLLLCRRKPVTLYTWYKGFVKSKARRMWFVWSNRPQMSTFNLKVPILPLGNSRSLRSHPAVSVKASLNRAKFQCLNFPLY